jgi:thioester reductase-like protein
MTTDATVLLTGFPGFLGSALLPRLLARGEGPVACLVQSHHRETAERRLPAIREAAREHATDVEQSDEPRGAQRDLPAVQLVEGDITEPDLGLGETRASLLGVDTVYHLAAVYDLAVERAVGEAVNVDGTRHVLAFATDAGVDRFHYVSTCYVSGRYDGVFTERHLREGQSFNNHYEATKYRAEVAVREATEAGLPATVYRPAIVVGDSRTGETEKFDGPYHFFRVLDTQPGPVAVVPRLPGAARTELNVVPRDFVVDAITALSGRADTAGETFQLCDPAPATVPGFVDAVADAMDQRAVAVPAPKPVVRRGMRALDRVVATEPATVDYFDHPTRYANPATQRALADTDLRCPPLATYVDRLVEYYRRNPDGRVEAMV